jgi:hypothetical protein
MRRKHIDIPDTARRDFLKYTIGLGTTLGIRPWKIFEVNESLIGPAFADGTCSPVNRFVGNVMGNGGLAWMTQLWPFADQSTTGGAAFYATGQATDQEMGKSDHPMKLGPAAPDLKGMKVTGFICGSNETHTGRPTSALSVGTGVGLFAAISAMQTASPALVPTIGIGNLPYGMANGAPQVTAVGAATGMVDLFNSAASSAGAVLASSENATLFEAYYKAQLALQRAAVTPTRRLAYGTSKSSAGLVGKNLASQLKPTADDLTRYRIDAGTPSKIANIATTLITTVKCFQLNLTNAVLLPGMNDDPHGAFSDMATLTSTVQSLGKIWSAFVADLMATDDPLCAGAKLGQNTVITWTGDTGKDPNDPSGWPDGTPQNSNWMYVVGANLLRSGWFGQIKGDGTIETWNPTTGANMPGGSSASMSGPAGAAVLYAVSRGDMRRVQDFYRGPAITGVIVPKNM